MITANNYVTIDLDVISRNFQNICQKAGVPVMAVVKADAYGHGAVPIARLLEPSCAWFGVSSVDEALELRRAGLQKPILILCHTPPSVFPTLIQENLRPAIFCWEDALALSAAAVQLNATAAFHFAVDTGMSRIGFQVTEETADICAAIARLPGLEAEGLFSHFATADSADLSGAHMQAQLFAQFDEMLRARGVCVKLRHLDNSAGVMNFSNHYEMVRAGIVIYGLYPSSEVDPGCLPLEPALRWCSRVSHLTLLPAGRSIGYGGTYVTDRPTMVATIPVGYADGYRRSLSNRFYVLIRGKRAPILGRVCMDQLMVDVTDIPNVASGDEVVLIGQDGNETITVEQLAEAAGSFNYEIICGISRRVPREYLQAHAPVCQIHYLLHE